MNEVQPGGTTPAPRITDPPPGGHVTPNADAAVTVTSNAPTLPLELVLLSADYPAAELARAEIDPGAGFPSTHRIAIPPDPEPGQPAAYYLAVGVRAEAASEQYRHVIPVNTRRPAEGP